MEQKISSCDAEGILFACFKSLIHLPTLLIQLKVQGYSDTRICVNSYILWVKVVGWQTGGLGSSSSCWCCTADVNIGSNIISAHSQCIHKHACREHLPLHLGKFSITCLPSVSVHAGRWRRRMVRWRRRRRGRKQVGRKPLQCRWLGYSKKKKMSGGQRKWEWKEVEIMCMVTEEISLLFTEWEKNSLW